MIARRVGAGIFALALSALVAAPTSCSSGGQPCAPGDFQYCDCPSASRGYHQCLDDGSTYGACDCSGTVPSGAGILVEAGMADSAPKAEGGLASFLETCTTDADCTTNLCFPMNAYGPHCSLPCKKDLDCPAPSPGCSNKGACKLH